jgi:histidinol-phosphate aminotransferase
MKIDSHPPNITFSHHSSNSIRLDQSESSYLPCPEVIQAIYDATSKINRYPQVQSDDLRSQLAIYTNKKPSQIVVGNGSDDLIELIIKLFVSYSEQVLIPIPTFPWYWYAAKNLDRQVLLVNRTNKFELDVTAILQDVTSLVKVIFIANPNNPTANLIPRSQIVELVRQVKCLVVVDECYYEFCEETVADLVDVYPNLIVLRSFSKGFALAGLRIGYAIAPTELASCLRNNAQFFGVNALAQAAAITTLANLEYYCAQIKRTLQARTSLASKLLELDFYVYPSATNFLFIGTQKLSVTSSDITEILKTKNIYVKDCVGLPGLDNFYFRISVGNDTENSYLVSQLRQMKLKKR